MNNPTKLFLSTLAVSLIAGCQPSSQDSGPAPVTTESSLETQVNYALGFNYAQQLQQSGIALDAAAFASGFQDAADQSEPQISMEDMQAAFESYQQQMQSEAMAAQESAAAENQAAAEEFLAENASAEGVMTTDSGLQYKIIEEGDGEIPGPDSQVQVHYEGRLLDGTVFDSSYERGTPVEFGVSQVIDGWTEALQMMPEGSTWQLYIPPSLGYGPSGAGGLIGPNELLVFDVELLDASYEAPAAEDSDSESAAE